MQSSSNAVYSLHFWSGYNCLVQEGTKVYMPRAVAVSDVINITSDLQNNIPDKSWMLYLLEIFNGQDTPVELNLICSFNDDGRFHAIFGGVNRYEFRIRPTIGHSYLRQIVMEPQRRSISYLLMDEASGQTDSFRIENLHDLTISRHFTGLEWHNRQGNFPHPIRYEVEISSLAYGVRDDPSDPQSVAYYPYNQLLPESEGLASKYPVSFHSFEVRHGFISYKIASSKDAAVK